MARRARRAMAACAFPATIERNCCQHVFRTPVPIVAFVRNAYEKERLSPAKSPVWGAPHTEATIETCAERPGPIIMTTLAMVAGMLPAALGHRIGVEFRAPMAVAAISGLMVSTVLMRPSYDCELATRPTLHRAPG